MAPIRLVVTAGERISLSHVIRECCFRERTVISSRDPPPFATARCPKMTVLSFADCASKMLLQPYPTVSEGVKRMRTFILLFKCLEHTCRHQLKHLMKAAQGGVAPS